MPDPADQRAAYREALARAEAAATDFVEETPAIPADAVEVVASGQPEPVETPAEEVVAEETSAEPVVEEVLTDAQYREQILALEARLAEKDTFIGRQSSEVGELREAINSLSQRFDAPQPAQFQVTQEWIDNDPASATIAAFEKIKDNPNPNPQDVRDVERAFEAWKEYEPFNAATWRSDELRAREAKALRAELEATRSEVQTIAASAQETAKQTEVNKQWKLAIDTVSEQFPEFRSNSVRILEDVAPRFPHLVETLANGDANVKAEVLTALYVIDRQNNTDPETVRQQLEEAAAAATAEAQATRAAAAGVVSQTSAGKDGTVLSYEQQEQERYKQRHAQGASLERGWTGRKI